MDFLAMNEPRVSTDLNTSCGMGSMTGFSSLTGGSGKIRLSACHLYVIM